MPLFRRRQEPDEPLGSAAPPPDLPAHWREWRRVPPEREELAGEIEASTDFGVEPAGPGRFAVNLFDDVRGLVGDPAIEALPAKLAGLAGVGRCEHSDREIIEVDGLVTAEQLTAFVIAELAATADPDYWEYG